MIENIDFNIAQEKKKKKVLYIEAAMGFGGGMVSLHEIVRHLKEYEPILVFYDKRHKEIHECFKPYKSYHLGLYFTYKDKSMFHNFIEKKFSNANIKFLLKKAYTLVSVIYDIVTKMRLIIIAKREKISLIHCNNYIDPLHLKVGRRLKVPVVVYLRGHIDCTGSDRSINKYFGKLLAPTNKIRNFAVDSLKVEPSKIEIVHDSVDIPFFSDDGQGKALRENYGIDQDAVIVGVFARITRMKGQAELIFSMIELLHKGYNLICMIVGDESDTNQTYFNNIKQLSDNSGFANRFIFTGYQNNVQAYYNAVDIVVHPSIEDEAFGRVIIEAWAARKPVIATDIAASLELIEDGIDGLIVPCRDIGKMRDAIAELAKNPAQRISLGNNGYHKVKKYFDSKIITEKIENIYEQLLSRKNKTLSNDCAH